MSSPWPGIRERDGISRRRNILFKPFERAAFLFLSFHKPIFTSVQTRSGKLLKFYLNQPVQGKILN
jgi:hypothetical protein